MQYSLFTHGNALKIENPENLVSHISKGWGMELTFKPPALGVLDQGLIVDEEFGPGSWFHIPLTSTLTTFGRQTPRLKSVTILFEALHCSIEYIHVYDGAQFLQGFNFGQQGSGLEKQEFLDKRNDADINPEVKNFDGNGQTHSNTFELAGHVDSGGILTFELEKPPKVFSAIGVSFFARAHLNEFKKVPDLSTGRSVPDITPQARLTIAGAGCQFFIDKRLSIVDALAQVILGRFGR